MALTGAPSGEHLIRRAARVAERSHGELLGVHIRGAGTPTEASSRRLDRHRELLADLGGEYHQLVSDDVVVALIRFAHDENATQLVLGSSRRSRWAELTRGSIINRVVRESGDLDVHVMSVQPDREREPDGRRIRRMAPLPLRRRQAGWLVAVAGTGALTVALTAGRGTFGQGTQYLLYQVVVLLAALTGGIAPAVVAAVLSSAALHWFFTPPFHTWSIDDPENALALVVFLIVGVLVGVLVTALARRSADARRGRAEAEALARIATSMIGAADPLPLMLESIRSTLGLEGIAVYKGPERAPVATAGVAPDPVGVRAVEFPGGVLEIRGRLRGDDERMLAAFTAQLTATLERQALREEAERAEALAAVDNLRTAILRAVSHDLRTPLASIKASVTSLLQTDIHWSPDAEREFLCTVDEEADRLDTVIGNLLDASRLEAGAITPANRPVALDEIVSAAFASISGLRSPIDVNIPPELPPVNADPGLLERAVANLVTNADNVTPADATVRVTAGLVVDKVQLRIIDQGPGVPPGQREEMFRPFQRLGDTTTDSGVGLGLAVARGTIDAMGGNLAAEDTPGGGLTMVVTLPIGPDCG